MILIISLINGGVHVVRHIIIFHIVLLIGQINKIFDIIINVLIVGS